MRAFVITIPIKESEQVAERCIKSAARYGVTVEPVYGVTPKDDPVKIAEDLGIPTQGFVERYSRFENCLSAFLSHHKLWSWSVENNEEILILEHDAYFNNEIPSNVTHRGVLSLGAPSYGKYNIPKLLGVNPLQSKAYLPGAHAYIVKPEAAKVLIEKAKEFAQPTDIFLANYNFPFMDEYYPWPVSAKDSFSTIQNEEGCHAKHNNGPGYKLL
jgi:GR25 family glycosyltransferase involved in LPS biosynthesis